MTTFRLEPMPPSSDPPDPVGASSRPRSGAPFVIDSRARPALSVPSTPVIVNLELHDPALLANMITHRLTPIIAASDDGKTSRAVGTYASYGGIFVSCARFTGTWTYDFVQPFAGVIFYLPTHGQVRADLAHGSVVGTVSSAIAIEAAHCRRLTFTHDFARRAIAVPRRALSERLASLLKRQTVEYPVFEIAVDASTPGMLALQALMDFATSSALGLALNDGALRAQGLRESLIDALLEVWPHSHSKAVHAPPATVVPRHVKFATDYLAANPKATMNGEDLAAKSGVSLRSLQQGFTRFVGMPIAAYHRHIRLQHAYDDLLAYPSRPIEDIARKWGFTNAGRFTKYFREAYGASPSDISKDHHWP
jgi:AraC-like DNA-binding protein